jgi:hypothetical protein
MKDTYLSIDMDFWSQCNNYKKVNKFMRSLSSTGIKPVVVKYHHEIVKHINGMEGVNRVLNMDYHSDIADISECTERGFNEGTWGNYIKLYENHEFVWYYPMKKCVSMTTGYCHCGSDNPFDKKCQGLFNWTRILKTYGEVPEHEFSRLAGIGICLSPNWNRQEHVLYFVQLLIELGYVDTKIVERLLESTDESLEEIEEFRLLNKKFLYTKR